MAGTGCARRCCGRTTRRTTRPRAACSPTRRRRLTRSSRPRRGWARRVTGAFLSYLAALLSFSLSRPARARRAHAAPAAHAARRARARVRARPRARAAALGVCGYECDRDRQGSDRAPSTYTCVAQLRREAPPGVGHAPDTRALAMFTGVRARQVLGAARAERRHPRRARVGSADRRVPSRPLAQPGGAQAEQRRARARALLPAQRLPRDSTLSLPLLRSAHLSPFPPLSLSAHLSPLPSSSRARRTPRARRPCTRRSTPPAATSSCAGCGSCPAALRCSTSQI